MFSFILVVLVAHVVVDLWVHFVDEQVYGIGVSFHCHLALSVICGFVMAGESGQHPPER